MLNINAHLFCIIYCEKCICGHRYYCRPTYDSLLFLMSQIIFHACNAQIHTHTHRHTQTHTHKSELIRLPETDVKTRCERDDREQGDEVGSHTLWKDVHPFSSVQFLQNEIHTFLVNAVSWRTHVINASGSFTHLLICSGGGGGGWCKQLCDPHLCRREHTFHGWRTWSTAPWWSRSQTLPGSCPSATGRSIIIIIQNITSVSYSWDNVRGGNSPAHLVEAPQLSEPAARLSQTQGSYSDCFWMDWVHFRFWILYISHIINKKYINTKC